MSLNRTLIILLTLTLTHTTLSYLRLRNPPQRSSVWRESQYKNLKPPQNYDDNNINCGAVHQDEEFGTCGICGDPLTIRPPRDNEDGGKYGKKIIVGKYKAGQEVGVSMEIYPLRLGYIEFHLCDQVPETEECFKPINFANGKGRQEVVTSSPKFFNTTVLLPMDLTCERCVLRAQLRTGNSWGECEDEKQKMGCGPQEAFRNCADITIS